MHTPCLRLAMPATVADAYHLLRRGAETKPDPVVFIEHKALYTLKKPSIWTHRFPAGARPAIRRQGRDLVIVTYSRQVHYALEAARMLAAQGV